MSFRSVKGFDLIRPESCVETLVDKRAYELISLNASGVGDSNVGQLPNGQNDTQYLDKAEESVDNSIQQASVTWADCVAGKRSAEAVHPKQLS